MRVATPASRRAGQPRGGVTGGPVGFVENLATDDRMLFGTNPDVPDFGGRHFASQDGSLSMSAHSEYWDLRSPSLENIGHIVAGQRP